MLRTTVRLEVDALALHRAGPEGAAPAASGSEGRSVSPSAITRDFFCVASFLDIDLGREVEKIHPSHGAPLDDRVEAAIAERQRHLELLTLHELSHEGRYVVAAHMLRVRALAALDDAAAVREKVGDDVRLVQAAVLGLDVEREVSVLDVIVEADLRPQKRRAHHLALELLQSSSSDQRPMASSRGPCSLATPSIRSKASFREVGRRIDAQRLGGGALAPRGIVRAVRGPDGEQGHRVVGAPLVEQPLGDARSAGACRGGAGYHAPPSSPRAPRVQAPSRDSRQTGTRAVAVASVVVLTVALAARALLAERQTVDDVFHLPPLRPEPRRRTAPTPSMWPPAGHSPPGPSKGRRGVAWTLLLAAGLGGRVAWARGRQRLMSLAAGASGAGDLRPGRGATRGIRGTSRPMLMALGRSSRSPWTPTLATWAVSGMGHRPLDAGLCRRASLSPGVSAARPPCSSVGARLGPTRKGPLFAAAGSPRACRGPPVLRLRLAASRRRSPSAVLTMLRGSRTSTTSRPQHLLGEDERGRRQGLHGARLRRLRAPPAPASPRACCLRPRSVLRHVSPAYPPAARVALALLVASFHLRSRRGRRPGCPTGALLVVALPLAAVLAAFALARTPRAAVGVGVGVALLAEAALYACDHSVDQDVARARVARRARRVAGARSGRPFIRPLTRSTGCRRTSCTRSRRTSPRGTSVAHDRRRGATPTCMG